MESVINLLKKAIDRYSSVIIERPYYIDCCTICGLVLFFSLDWLCPQIPSDDFPGNVSLLWFFRTAFEQGDFPLWCQTWFCGFPLTMLYSKFFSFFLCLPYAAVFGDFLGLKLALITGHILSGIVIYFFVLYLIKNKGSALLGALIYCLHPIYISETAQKGHLEVSLFFIFVPLAFWSIWQVTQKPTMKNVVWSATIIMLGLWTNNEGAVSVYPFLIVPFLFLSLRNRKTLSQLKNMWAGFGFVVVISLCLSAFFIIPVFLDLGQLNSFTPEYVTKTVEQFSLKNLLYFVNRDNVIGSLFNSTALKGLFVFGGDFYCGLVPLLLGLIYLFLRPHKRDDVFLFSLLLFTLSMFFSFGPYTLHGVVLKFVDAAEIFDSGTVFVTFLGLLPLVFGACFLLCRQRCSLTYRAYIKMAAISLAIACIPFYSLLTWAVPFYGHSRSPQWFFISLAPFSLALIGAVAYAKIADLTNSKTIKSIFLLVCCSVLLVDFIPYKAYFSHFEAEPRIKTMERAFTALNQDMSDCKTLSLETYEPALDLGPLYSKKAAGWYWLNWTCMKNTADVLFRSVYPRLWRGDHKGAQNLAAVCGVKYFIDDRVKKGNLAQANMYHPLYEDKIFSVYQNPLYKNTIRPYSKKAIYIGKNMERKLSLLSFLNTQNVALVDIPMDVLPRILADIDYVFWDAAKLDAFKETFHPDLKFFDMTRGDDISIPPCAEPEIVLNWARPSHDEIKISITTKEVVLLAVAESYHQFWKASTGSMKFRILQTQHAFMGIVVPKGKHNIQFQYSPSWLYYSGFIVTFITLLTIVSLILGVRSEKVIAFMRGTFKK